MIQKALPVGVEDFEDMITKNYYYVDKTLLIKQVLDLKAEAVLFTRPRRFGKTLNQSMLRYFFEDTGSEQKNEAHRKLFAGLAVMQERSMCDYYAECFGFTRQEVQKMAEAYDCADELEELEKWYDGYQFGNADLFNPWSIINYIGDLTANKSAFPRTYWANTSSNEIIKILVKKAETEDKAQIERLIRGETLDVVVHEEVTYEDMYSRGDTLWNFLLFTGYLTKQESWMDGQHNLVVRLAIPNLEVKKVYERTILAWFKEQLRVQDFNDLYEAMEIGDAQAMQEVLNQQLQRSIFFYDSAENFYHGFMAGILSQSRKYCVKSNRESGSGRSDLIVYPLDLEKKAFVLELKASAAFKDTQKDAQAAVKQARDKRYGDELLSVGYEDIDIYGIAFYRKNCRVCCGGAYDPGTFSG